MVERRNSSSLRDRAPHKEKEELPRVFVVGMGIVSPLGLDLPTTWGNLKAGKNGISNIEIEWTDIKIAGKINDFNAEKMLSGVVTPKDIRRLARPAQLGSAAASEALRDAGLPAKREELEAKVDTTRFGVYGATGIGGANEIPRVSDRLKAGRKPSPFDILIIEPERVATVVGMQFGLKGPTAAAIAACASGNMAITNAYKDIRLGDVDLALVVAAESTLDSVTLELFNSPRALSRSKDTSASRPFDKKRDGFVMGEGGAAMILASEEAIKRLGLRPRAEVVSYGNTADAGNDTEPTGEGAERAMKIALQRAGSYRPETVYVNAHATSTSIGDRVEGLTIKKVFGEDAKKIAISSTKGSIGHLMGGAGTAEAIFCIKALQEGIVPPTLNLEEPMDEGEGLNLVPKEAQLKEVDTAINNSFGFGGINSVTIFKRPD